MCAPKTMPPLFNGQLKVLGNYAHFAAVANRAGIYIALSNRYSIYTSSRYIFVWDVIHFFSFATRSKLDFAIFNWFAVAFGTLMSV